MKQQQDNRQIIAEQTADTDRLASERRARRLLEMKKKKARQQLFRKYIRIGLPALAILVIASVTILKFSGNAGAESNTHPTAESEASQGTNAQDAAEQDSAGQDSAGQDSANQDAAEQASQPQETTCPGIAAQGAAILGTAASAIPETGSTAPGNVLPGGTAQDTDNTPDDTDDTDATETGAAVTIPPVYIAAATADTLTLTDEIVSSNALFIDLESGNILARKASDTVISPASMTKVLTILVAAEALEESQLEDTFTMTLEITDYSYTNDCSSAGFLDDEVLTVRDLFYGTILPSGADAAVGLAVYTAGSHEAFVEKMNEKLEELGLSETAHVTNCVGLYDPDHHCTVYDMAMIMEAALDNDICREVMTAHTYTTSATPQHPDGILLSNWFLRRIEDKDTGGEVICAKTGYVVQSGSCAVSYGVDHAGREYVCVTANSTSSWRCIYDHVALYQMFATTVSDL